MSTVSPAQEQGVLPHEVGLRLFVPGADEETACSVDVKRVVHGVIRVHLVNQSDLHPLAHRGRPGDVVVLCPGLPVD